MPPSAHADLAPVLQSGQLSGAHQVAALEAKFAAWLDADDAVATSDASGALTLALYFAGVKPGDEVVVSPMACAATLMPIANLFAKPVWCDVDPLTGMPDAAAVMECVTNRTRAVLLYHWSGDVGDIEEIAALSRERGVRCIEDATEAFGADAHGKRLGGAADFTVYSLYATKHINTGDGGMILAGNAERVDALRRLRRFGIERSQLRQVQGDLNPHLDIPSAGFNFAMNEIAATLGLAAMGNAEAIVARYRDNGRFYETALQDIPGIRRLVRRPDATSGYWTYSLLAERRDDLIRKLAGQGIGAQRLHIRADGYSCFQRGREDLPGVAEFDAQNVSLPCGWWVGAEDRARVAECIKAGW